MRNGCAEIPDIKEVSDLFTRGALRRLTLSERIQDTRHEPTGILTFAVNEENTRPRIANVEAAQVIQQAELGAPVRKGD